MPPDPFVGSLPHSGCDIVAMQAVVLVDKPMMGSLIDKYADLVEAFGLFGDGRYYR